MRFVWKTERSCCTDATVFGTHVSPIGKTSNAAQAKRSALKLFPQTEFKLDEGLPVQSRSFSDVIDQDVAKTHSYIDENNDAMKRAAVELAA